MKAEFAVPLLLAAMFLPTQSVSELSSGSTGYEFFPGLGSYKFYSEPQTWAMAVQTCLQDGGQLGTINSDEEAQVYYTIQARYSTISSASIQGLIFAGLFEFHESRNFFTLDGVPVAESGYSKWKPGEPNNAGGNAEKCGAIDHNSELNDMPCSYMQPFICELKYSSSTRIH